MGLSDYVQPLLSGSSLASATPPPKHGVPLFLRILTHNIRYAATNLFTNERPWLERYPLILSALQHEIRFLHGISSGPTTASAFICLQEVLHPQLVNILDGLNGLEPSEHPEKAKPANGPIWAYIGVGRDDGNRKGEYNPIIYPVQTYKLLHYETVWLSETPDKPSLGWDAGCIRMVNLGVFEHKANGRRILACNTHLDNAGSVSRVKSVGIIVATIKRISKQWRYSKPDAEEDSGIDMPVFLTGDFNSFPEQEAYLAMQSSGLVKDMHTLFIPEERYGEEDTFTSFRPDKHKDELGRIDFLWLGPSDSISTKSNKERDAETVRGNTEAQGIGRGFHWDVQGYAVLPNVFEAGIYNSDHRAVVGDVILR